MAEPPRPGGGGRGSSQMRWMAARWVRRAKRAKGCSPPPPRPLLWPRPRGGRGRLDSPRYLDRAGAAQAYGGEGLLDKTSRPRAALMAGPERPEGLPNFAAPVPVVWDSRLSRDSTVAEAVKQSIRIMAAARYEPRGRCQRAQCAVAMDPLRAGGSVPHRVRKCARISSGSAERALRAQVREDSRLGAMRSAPGAVERLLIGRGVAILGAIRAGHRMGTGTDGRTGVGTWLDLHGGCLGRDAGVEPGAVDGGVLDRFRGDRGGSGAKRARGRSPPPHLASLVTSTSRR